MPNRMNTAPSISGTTSITQTVAAAINPGLVQWAQSSFGFTRRNASVSITMIASPRYGLKAFESGGTDRPMKIDAAATNVP